MAIQAWLAGGLALVVTACLTPQLRRWLLARGILDWPGDRRSHEQPTPRGGGLVMLLGLTVALLSLSAHTPSLLVPVIYALAVGALGWLEDRYELPIRVRLLVMLVCAIGLLVHFGPITQVEVAGLVLVQPWLWSILAVVAVVWLINLHNFMDGSDGLAAMQGTFSGLVLGWLLYQGGDQASGVVGFALGGACAGFLIWNRPPARLFMGDVGSLLVGGMLGWLAYAGAAQGVVSVWLSLMVCALFVVDATATLLSRVVSGGQWYTPHREHAYQRLIQAGWSHARVLALYGAINGLLVLPLIMLVLYLPAWELPMVLLLLAVLAGGWATIKRRALTENQTA